MERKTTPKAICHIFNYPTNRTEIMMEQEIKILTSTDTPGKVKQDVIYFLATLEQGQESIIRAAATIYTPGGGTVALALVDVTKERRKRKERTEARNVCPSKQVNVKGKFSHSSF